MRGTPTVLLANLTSFLCDVSEPLVKRSAGALSRAVGSSLLITSEARDEYQELSATARVIWDLLDEPTSAKQIAELLADRYRRPVSAIAPDVEAVVHRLIESGLVKEAPRSHV